MAYDGPTKCVTCEELGCPTEGFTKMCSKCGRIYCFGHFGRHREEAHNLCYLCDEELPCPEHSSNIKSKKVEQRKALTLEEFKLACISDEELADEQVSPLMRMVVLGSEEEVLKLCTILHKYRPEVEKKFAEELKESGAVTSPAFSFFDF